MQTADALSRLFARVGAASGRRSAHHEVEEAFTKKRARARQPVSLREAASDITCTSYTGACPEGTTKREAHDMYNCSSGTCTESDCCFKPGGDVTSVVDEVFSTIFGVVGIAEEVSDSLR
jgi:hypothetical protein